MRTGDASILAGHSEQERIEIFKTDESDHKSKREMIQPDYIARKLEHVSLSFSTVQGATIFDTIHELQQQLDDFQAENTEYFQPLIPVIDQVKEKFASFKKDQFHQIDFILDWCIDHGLIQQGYTFLDEFIISSFCDYLGWDRTKRDDRILITSGIEISYQNIPEEEWELEEVQKERLKEKYDEFLPLKKRYNITLYH